MTHTHARLSRTGRLVLFCGIAAAIVVADQLLKASMRSLLAAGRRTLIPGVMDLVLVENTGAAFSLGEGSGWIFVVIAVVVALGCLYFVATHAACSVPFTCALAAVAGGGLGNCWDRIASGAVTDYFATTFIDYPVFNLADIFITLGTCASVICYVRMSRHAG